MAACVQCGAFINEPAAKCGMCGAMAAATKPLWVTALDALPGPQDDWPNNGLTFLVWFLALACFGLWWWPWWAAVGTIIVSLFLSVPATLLSTVVVQQLARLWQQARPMLIHEDAQGGLLALEEQSQKRLLEDQEALDGLIAIMNREQHHPDLLPGVEAVEYRKRKVLPVFSQTVKLSVSALLEIETRRLVNRCEQICDGLETCDHTEFNRRYEQLDALHRELRTIRNRWSGYILSRVVTPEVAVLSERQIDYFDPRLQPDSTVLTTDDLARLDEAEAILKSLRHLPHQTQEIQLLKSAHPLTADAALPGSPLNSLSVFLSQLQGPDRLGELEREYQRIVAEQRVVQDTSRSLQNASIVPSSSARSPSSRDDFKNPIDAPPVLPNSDLVPEPLIQ